jgi:hypothetical protein
MLALLAERSAFTVQRAPARHTNGEALMQAIRPTNASVSRLRHARADALSFRLHLAHHLPRRR